MICYSGLSIGSNIRPCGQCMACRINKKRAWTARIIMEWASTPARSWFVTWTYSDDHIPRTVEGDVTLRHKEARAAVKEYRRVVDGDFRHYLVGEYGKDGGRPHYHLAIFPSSDAVAAELYTKWDKGRQHWAELTPQRCAYLADYTTKNLTRWGDDRLRVGQEPEFRTSSKRPALGESFVDPLVERYRNGKGKVVLHERGDVERQIRLMGKVYPIPKFILDKVRAKLDIPLKHEDRLCHPGYYQWHQTRGAEQCIDTAEAQKVILDAKARRAKARTNRL